MDGKEMEFLLDAVDRFPVREEFADNLEQPDPVPLLDLLQNGVVNQDAGAANSGSGMAQVAGEDDSPVAQEDAQRHRAASPTRSAQSIDGVNPEAPGWTKSHALRVMEILHMEEIPKHHIVKRWTRDTRDILPDHLVQYQKESSQNPSFTFRHATLYLKVVEVVRMGDTSAASYDHVHAGLEALLRSGAALAEKSDGLAFEDRLVENAAAIPAANGELVFVPVDTEQCRSPGHSLSVNAMQNLVAPDKHRGAGRPTNSQENAPYEGLSKRTIL